MFPWERLQSESTGEHVAVGKRTGKRGYCRTPVSAAWSRIALICTSVASQEHLREFPAIPHLLKGHREVEATFTLVTLHNLRLVLL
jgi:hypothetical protein